MDFRRRAIVVALVALVLSLGSHAAAAGPVTGRTSARLIIGADFLSATTGWIAVGQSGSYVTNGGCGNGIGSNCDTSETIVYRTDDGGATWKRLLHFRSLPGPPIWIRIFNASDGLAATTVGPVKPSSSDYYDARSVLFRTTDGGLHWSRAPLPKGYSVDLRTITFPAFRHGWLFYGGAAMGSMSVFMYRTANGGRSWARVACASVPYPLPKYGCRLHSGIEFGGDKAFLTFSNAYDGWLTVYSNGGVPEILRSGNGGRSWRYQSVGLPPGVHLAHGENAVYPMMGNFGQPRLFGRAGILPELVTFYPPRSNKGWTRLFIFRSSDGGATWRFDQKAPVRSPSVEELGFSDGALSSFPRSHEWLFVGGRRIWRTAEAGATWSHVAMHIPGNRHLVSLSFEDLSNGWAMAMPPGNDGGLLGGTSLLRTTDGGERWSVIRLPH